MTVIVFDGETLAADRRACRGDLHRTVTKIFPFGEELAAITGDTALGLELLAWYRGGAKPQDFPKLDETDDAELIVVAADGTLLLYERKPIPIVFHERKAAFGCGAKYALGAMAMGADAVQAALIACQYSVSCGNGIDAYRRGGVKVAVN